MMSVAFKNSMRVMMKKNKKMKTELKFNIHENKIAQLIKSDETFVDNI